MSTNTNWNRISKSNLQYLYDQGCELGMYENELFLIVPDWDVVRKYPKYFDNSDNWGFNDEYTMCSECYQNVIRTSPDSYSWQPDYLKTDDMIACRECAMDYQDDLIQDIQDRIDHNKQPKSLLWIYELGDDWIRIPVPGYEDKEYIRWENGLHPGQRDDPLRQGKIIRSIKLDNQPIFQVVFRVYSGQFDVEWDVYIRIDPDLDIRLSNDQWSEHLSYFSNQFYSENGKYPHDLASIYSNALKNVTGRFNRITANPENGTYEIKSNDNLEDYLNQ